MLPTPGFRRASCAILVGAHSRSDPDLDPFPCSDSPVKRRRFRGKSETVKHVDVKKERSRAPMCEATYAVIRARLALGEIQHDIAADLGINQGRISEVNTGKRGDPNQLSLI